MKSADSNGTGESVSRMAGLRARFHAGLLSNGVITATDGTVSIADSSSLSSKKVAQHLCSLLGLVSTTGKKGAGQTAGHGFEGAVREFVEEAFALLDPVRPGTWRVATSASEGIAAFEQFEHLAAIDKFCKTNVELRAFLGSGYVIRPDIVMSRLPLSDAELNARDPVVHGDDVALLTSLRAVNNSEPLLHASISCKLTLRTDRAQNARTEALNLIRNRKGRVPHICVVTAEPMPNRLASLALGTGDIDCVYHVALPELRAAIAAVGSDDMLESLDTMREGKRLKDIADLPFDLAL